MQINSGAGVSVTGADCGVDVWPVVVERHSDASGCCAACHLWFVLSRKPGAACFTQS